MLLITRCLISSTWNLGRLQWLFGILVHNSWYRCSRDQELHKLAMQLFHGPPVKSQLPFHHRRPLSPDSNCHSHGHKRGSARDICHYDENGSVCRSWSQPSSNDDKTRRVTEVYGHSHCQVCDRKIQFWGDFDERKSRAQGEDPGGGNGIPAIDSLRE